MCGAPLKLDQANFFLAHLCPILNCGARFSVPSNLKRHVKGHKSTGSQPRGRKRRSAARREVSPKPRHHALQERKNAQPPCPESLRGMHNLNDLSSRPPFKMPEGVAVVPLPTPLPAIRPRGHPGDENYEERDSFFYARETDQPTPYHPLMWKMRRVLPGPLPSQAELEGRARGARGARGAYGFGDSLSELREWGDDRHRV
ncbi:hypothetical protein BN14_00940 [Rhizoctonia solani AG-1 IB]|uniref:C2H2-type domain-containing protein n=1 Tax=Thanatephorus cucumeris (strain AG1-IB / isolate 7/3/14) TaxID=1108050 RepID=M5BIG9_THACB|nr:hypothetical protein BN14_00940 [Rhizoctonia solani AG-1 IB]